MMRKDQTYHAIPAGDESKDGDRVTEGRMGNGQHIVVVMEEGDDGWCGQ